MWLPYKFRSFRKVGRKKNTREKNVRKQDNAGGRLKEPPLYWGETEDGKVEGLLFSEKQGDTGPGAVAMGPACGKRAGASTQTEGCQCGCTGGHPPVSWPGGETGEQSSISMYISYILVLKLQMSFCAILIHLFISIISILLRVYNS